MGSPTKTERNIEIYRDLVERGLTYVECAAKHSLNPSRVGQIVTRLDSPVARVRIKANGRTHYEYQWKNKHLAKVYASKKE
jgi:hypothetical protein